MRAVEGMKFLSGRWNNCKEPVLRAKRIKLTLLCHIFSMLSVVVDVVDFTAFFLTQTLNTAI
jgi:hypothetical protein